MSSQAMRALPRADAAVEARVLSVGRQLNRLRPEIRPAAFALARQHERLGELALSFPALFVALAQSRAGFDPAPVIAGVIAGAPLARLAEQARVPMWLRRLAPRLLPARLPELPDSPFIRRRIANHLPRSARQADIWFKIVPRAARWSHEGFALWCAQHLTGRGASYYRARLNWLCLWAWYSVQDGAAAVPIETRWTPEIAAKAAMEAANVWHNDCDLRLNLGDAVLADMWLTPGEVDGYDFVPIRSAREVTEEAMAMCNCVCGYGSGLVHNQSRLWSVRQSGARVATLCVFWPGDDPLPHVGDLKLAHNAEAPAALWWTARKWLHAHDLPNMAFNRHDWNTRPLARAEWHRLWKPYWLAKRGVPDWLPLSPSRRRFDDL